MRKYNVKMSSENMKVMVITGNFQLVSKNPITIQLIQVSHCTVQYYWGIYKLRCAKMNRVLNYDHRMNLLFTEPQTNKCKGNSGLTFMK